MNMLSSTCLDEYCGFLISYPATSTSVTCRGCGQTHAVENFTEKTPAKHGLWGLRDFLLENQMPRRGPETIKVMGVSNYQHKLLSPLLTYYGMDKSTGRARLLKDLITRSTLDCSVFGDRCFSIERRHLDVSGYGRDQSGSAVYLADTLALLLPYNNDTESLVPIHVDGDGHCLVHAVSRALVGREMFWHPLRVDLKRHFQENLNIYKELLGDFINGSEWPCIIAECDPDFEPSDGIVGLRPIHVFGLANVLRRPILLLDSVAGMNTSADYAAVFIPGLSPPGMCSNKSGQLNPPLCLAWSSPARNHYIPLVPIKDSPLPQFPKHLLPKVWGLPQNVLEEYLSFNENKCLIIGGENCIQPTYMLRLSNAMNELFHSKYGAPTELVTDVYVSQYSRKTGLKTMAIVEATSAALQDRRLQRCLMCDAINILPLSDDWLRPKGLLYALAKKQFGFLQEDRIYPFTTYGMKRLSMKRTGGDIRDVLLFQGVTCRYNAKKDMLVIDSTVIMDTCVFCHGKLRAIHHDGTVAYENGDITNIPVKNPTTNHCPCGFKHWWKGIAYDNPPQEIPVQLYWKGIYVNDTVQWFQYESERSLNSNVYTIASYLLQMHFPGEFGSELLHQSIVQQILERVKVLPPPPTDSLMLEKEEACGGPMSDEFIPLRSKRDKLVQETNKNEKASSSKPAVSRLAKNSEENHEQPQFSLSRPGSGNIRPTIRVGPGMSMLSSTPVPPNSEAMDRFLQLMKRKSPSPPEPDSSMPSTKHFKSN